jgi:Zn-dependent peptidase ImmA (M78 family)
MDPSYHPDQEGESVFTLRVHPDAMAWVPDPPELLALQKQFPDPNMHAQILPRSMANATLGRNKPPYAFRAFTRDDTSYVFVDPTETRRSIAWLMAHELSHQVVHQHPEVLQMLDAARPNDIDPAGDLFHQVDPHERLCDGIATNLIGERLDRDWWRQRVEQRHTFARPIPSHR